MCGAHSVRAARQWTSFDCSVFFLFFRLLASFLLLLTLARLALRASLVTPRADRGEDGCRDVEGIRDGGV